MEIFESLVTIGVVEMGRECLPDTQYVIKGIVSKFLEFSLLLVRSYWNFHTICKIEKETLFVHENFSIQGLVLYIYTNILNIHIYKKE